MFQYKLQQEQLEASGVRLGDGCSILPHYGRKKAFTLNRKRIDLVSSHFRPGDLSMSYIELPRTDNDFHYRLELDEKYYTGRFFLKTLTGMPFWLNGLAAREAYVERSDKLYIDDTKINFTSFDLQQMTSMHFEHPVLLENALMQSDLNILICGETGTGKSDLAYKIHSNSGRQGKFVAVNLSSYNPQLIESELFGHRKGAFTGALSDKTGAFMEAQHGTLFLDEIDSLPMDLQTKLLTFLDNKKFRPVGENKEIVMKTRLIFASGRKLELLIDQEKLRRDFYYRLKSGHTIQLPSLRNDVIRISEACRWYCLKQGISLSVRLLEFYQTLAWPGNLRQLFGHLDKKKILTRSTKLDFDQLDEDLLLQSSDLQNMAFTEEIIPMKRVKEDYIKKAFLKFEGNISLTARKLHLSEKTVRLVVRN